MPSFMRNRPSSPRARSTSAGLTSLMRSTVEVVSGVWPCATIEIDPSRAKKIEVYGGTVIGPPSPSTGMTGAGGELTVRVDLQVAGACVGFLAVGALHGDPAVAVDGDVEIAAGRQQCAGLVVPAHRRIGGVDARGVAGTIDRTALECGQLGAKAGGARVGEVVVVDGLRVQGFLRAGHRHVEHAVHS